MSWGTSSKHIGELAREPTAGAPKKPKTLHRESILREKSSKPTHRLAQIMGTLDHYSATVSHCSSDPRYIPRRPFFFPKSEKKQEKNCSFTGWNTVWTGGEEEVIYKAKFAVETNSRGLLSKQTTTGGSP